MMHLTSRRLLIATASLMLLLLNACQMPSHSTTSLPSGSASGSSASSAPSSPTGHSGGMPSPSGDQGSTVGQDGKPSGDIKGADSSSGGPAETLGGLDQALDKSLEDFDQRLGGASASTGEIDILSPTGDSGVQTGTDEPLFEEADDSDLAVTNADFEQRASVGTHSQSAQSHNEQNPSQGNSSDRSQRGNSFPIPEDIGDGQSDDIVLRQIRDAATKETDPVLRERLWDEYRRIKKQS